MTNMANKRSIRWISHGKIQCMKKEIMKTRMKSSIRSSGRMGKRINLMLLLIMMRRRRRRRRKDGYKFQN